MRYIFMLLHEFSNTAAAVNFLVTLDEKLISGTKPPSWHDIQNATDALQNIRKEKAAAVVGGKIDTYIADLRVAAAKLKDDPAWLKQQRLSAEALIAESEEESLAAKLLYWDYIHLINHELPKELRIPIKTLPRAERIPKTEAQGVAIVQDQEKYFEKCFAKTSGFSSRGEYRAKVTASSKSDDTLRESLALLDDENVEFAMTRPERSRWWIKRTGFQNQHVTGSSSGTVGKEKRNAAEASLLGKTYEDYAKISDEVKARYGFLHKFVTEGTKIHAPADNYYDTDHFYFDKNKLRERVTFTVGDSLGDSMHKISENYLTGIVTTSDVYGYNFIPWSRRSVLASVIDPDIFKIVSNGDSKIGLKNMISSQYYTELQYWGHLDLSYVKKYAFSGNPPDGEFLEELNRFGIQIFDARAGRMKKWKP